MIECNVSSMPPVRRAASAILWAGSRTPAPGRLAGRLLLSGASSAHLRQLQVPRQGVQPDTGACQG